MKNLFLCLIILFTTQVVQGQKFNKNRLSLNVSVKSMYDDNILKNSEKYTDRFLANEDEGRFEIETYDDVFIQSKLAASYYFKFYKKKKTKISTTISNYSYLKNDIKSWNYYGFGIQQSFLKKASIKFAYSYIPSFYVRNFRQPDLVAIYGYVPSTFKPYIFSKNNYGLALQNTFSTKTKVKLTYDKAIYHHNSHYTEYDSKNNVFGLFVEHPLSKKIKVGVGYMYTNSDAKGYDEVGETKETSDESDATFVDNMFELKIKAKLPRLLKRKNGVDLKVKYAVRDFSSTQLISIDPLHTNRRDNNLRLYLSYNIRLSKKTKFSLYYNYLNRDSENNTGIYEEILSEEKDYIQNQVGFQVSYAIF